MFSLVRSEYTPFGTDDYFEPRVQDRKYYRYPKISFSGWLSTDSRKPLFVRIQFMSANIFSGYDQSAYSIGIEPGYRFSDRFLISHEIEVNQEINDIGYVSENVDQDSIYFGKRLNTTISNTINTSYIFNSNSYLTFRLRHYWSRADYDNVFYLLKEDGKPDPNDYSGSHDRNFNIFNVDMVYTWRFAPGSEISIVWKNSISQDAKEISYDFLDNLRNTLKLPQVNSLSIKILYYLDYQYLKRRA